MFTIGTVQQWVRDQDEALEFYTQRLGMEVRDDVTMAEMGNFRWLTVGPPKQPDLAVVLVPIPGPPVMDPEIADHLRGLMAMGFAGTMFLTTEDFQASYEELRRRGVEFSEEPSERPFGISSSFRDPSGNRIRLTEVREMPRCNSDRPSGRRARSRRGFRSRLGRGALRSARRC